MMLGRTDGILFFRIFCCEKSERSSVNLSKDMLRIAS